MIAYLTWNAFFSNPETEHTFRVVVYVLLSLLLLYTISFAASRLLLKRLSLHYAKLVRKLIFYVGCSIILVSVLVEMGINLTGILATAGVAGLAIGFAAQTSLSNLISGLFLIGERPFQIGDLVRVNDILGVVESIDLLSIKIRTMDNLFVRIPNESMIKDPVINVTRYPIRRMDLEIGVAYKEDVGKVMEVLRDLAARNPYALDDPEPLILFNNFGDSALQFKFGLWFEKSNFLKLRNSIMQEIKERFDREGIEIPFPHMTLYAGSVTDPFPIDLKDRNPSKS